MNGFLLDTNILSEFARREQADPAVKNWLAGVDDSALFVSVLALAELRRGIEALASGKRRLQLEQWLEQELFPFFENRILPITHAIADRWAILSIRLESQGKTRPLVDGLLAVTALEHDLTIITRNLKDFSGFGVPLLSPWD